MKKYYVIAYASNLWTSSKGREDRVVTSSVELKEDDFILIAKKGAGIFIGRVVKEVDERLITFDTKDYTYFRHIDLSDYIKEVENGKRKEELKVQMEKRFAEIDREKKYEYYSTLDEDFKKIFDEYKSL